MNLIIYLLIIIIFFQHIICFNHFLRDSLSKSIKDTKINYHHDFRSSNSDSHIAELNNSTLRDKRKSEHDHSNDFDSYQVPFDFEEEHIVIPVKNETAKNKGINSMYCLTKLASLLRVRNHIYQWLQNQILLKQNENDDMNDIFLSIMEFYDKMYEGHGVLPTVTYPYIAKTKLNPKSNTTVFIKNIDEYNKQQQLQQLEQEQFNKNNEEYNILIDYIIQILEPEYNYIDFSQVNCTLLFYRNHSLLYPWLTAIKTVTPKTSPNTFVDYIISDSSEISSAVSTTTPRITNYNTQFFKSAVEYLETYSMSYAVKLKLVQNQNVLYNNKNITLILLHKNLIKSRNIYTIAKDILHHFDEFIPKIKSDYHKLQLIKNAIMLLEKYILDNDLCLFKKRIPLQTINYFGWFHTNYHNHYISNKTNTMFSTSNHAVNKNLLINNQKFKTLMAFINHTSWTITFESFYFYNIYSLYQPTTLLEDFGDSKQNIRVRRHIYFDNYKVDNSTTDNLLNHNNSGVDQRYRRRTIIDKSATRHHKKHVHSRKVNITNRGLSPDKSATDNIRSFDNTQHARKNIAIHSSSSSVGTIDESATGYHKKHSKKQHVHSRRVNITNHELTIGKFATDNIRSFDNTQHVSSSNHRFTIDDSATDNTKSYGNIKKDVHFNKRTTDKSTTEKSITHHILRDNNDRQYVRYRKQISTTDKPATNNSSTTDYYVLKSNYDHVNYNYYNFQNHVSFRKPTKSVTKKTLSVNTSTMATEKLINDTILLKHDENIVKHVYPKIDKEGVSSTTIIPKTINRTDQLENLKNGKQLVINVTVTIDDKEHTGRLRRHITSTGKPTIDKLSTDKIATDKLTTDTSATDKSTTYKSNISITDESKTENETDELESVIDKFSTDNIKFITEDRDNDPSQLRYREYNTNDQSTTEKILLHYKKNIPKYSRHNKNHTFGDKSARNKLTTSQSIRDKFHHNSSESGKKSSSDKSHHKSSDKLTTDELATVKSTTDISHHKLKIGKFKLKINKFTTDKSNSDKINKFTTYRSTTVKSVHNISTARKSTTTDKSITDKPATDKSATIKSTIDKSITNKSITNIPSTNKYKATKKLDEIKSNSDSDNHKYKTRFRKHLAITERSTSSRPVTPRKVRLRVTQHDKRQVGHTKINKQNLIRNLKNSMELRTYLANRKQQATTDKSFVLKISIKESDHPTSSTTLRPVQYVEKEEQTTTDTPVIEINNHEPFINTKPLKLKSMVQPQYSDNANENSNRYQMFDKKSSVIKDSPPFKFDFLNNNENIRLIPAHRGELGSIRIPTTTELPMATVRPLSTIVYDNDSLLYNYNISEIGFILDKFKRLLKLLNNTKNKKLPKAIQSMNNRTSTEEDFILEPYDNLMTPSYLMNLTIYQNDKLFNKYKKYLKLPHVSNQGDYLNHSPADVME